MPDRLLLYIRALWKHWEKRLTGGLLVALAALWVYSGNTLFPGLGIALLGATFLAASFGAWREENTKHDLRVEIEAIVPEHEMFFSVHVLLTYLDKGKVSFKKYWELRTFDKAGTLLSVSMGHIVGQIRPMTEADQFEVKMQFVRPPNLMVTTINRYELMGADVYGNPLRAEWPDAAFRNAQALTQ